MQKLGFVGAGPVGTAFAVNLSQRGYRVVGVVDLDPAEAQWLADEISGCRPYASAQSLVDDADIVFITTPDDRIEEVAGGLIWRTGKAAVHCSGATTVRAFEAARRQGAMAGGIHPCQTFSGRDQAIANLPASTFGIEAEEPFRSTLTEIAQALDGDHVYLTSEDKALYHAAAFIAAGYTYTLVDIATDLWQHFGKSKEAATRAYVPLMQGTVNNIATIGFPGCPTGPITRGDVGTIEGHIVTLQKHAPDLLRLYKELGLKSLPVSVARGTLSEDKASELRALFEAAD